MSVQTPDHERLPNISTHDMLSAAAFLLQQVAFQNEETLRTTPFQLPVSKFHSSSVPGISVLDYLRRIRNYSFCGDSCFVAALIYIDRIQQSGSVVVESLNIHRLLVTSVMLAAKFLDDNHDTNRTYAQIGGVTNEEINQLELELVHLLDFSLTFSVDEYERCRGALLNAAAKLVSLAPVLSAVLELSPSDSNNSLPTSLATAHSPVFVSLSIPEFYTDKFAPVPVSACDYAPMQFDVPCVSCASLAASASSCCTSECLTVPPLPCRTHAPVDPVQATHMLMPMHARSSTVYMPQHQQMHSAAPSQPLSQTVPTVPSLSVQVQMQSPSALQTIPATVPLSLQPVVSLLCDKSAVEDDDHPSMEYLLDPTPVGPSWTEKHVPVVLAHPLSFHNVIVGALRV